MRVLNIVLAIAILYVVLYYRGEGYYMRDYAYGGSVGDSTGIRGEGHRVAGPFFNGSPEEMFPDETDPRSNLNVRGVKWPNSL
jgi:hypothetical protein